MRTSLSLSLFSLSLLYSFLFTSLHGATAAQEDLIYNTCKTCSQEDPNVDFSFCSSSLRAAPASQSAALSGLGMTSIRLVRNNVTDTRCQVKQLLKNTKLDPFVKGCLEDCFELYSDAILSAKQAMKFYNSKQFGNANTELSSVMDAATTCEEGFLEREGVISPLTKRNNDTFELSAMALSIMHIIQTGPQ